MRRVSTALAALVCAVAIAAPTTASASAAAPARTSDKFCAPLRDFYAIQFILAFASGFSEIGDDTVDADDVRATMLVALSPKMVKLSEQMIASGPKVLRRDLRAQLAVYREGVDLLRDAGASEKVIKAIANADFEEGSDPSEDLEKRTKLSKRKLEAAGKKYRKIIDDFDSVEPSSLAAAQAFDTAFAECGIFPDTRVDCRQLLDDAAVAAILGGPATLDDEQGCSWTTDEADDAENRLAVDVYATDDVYEDFLDSNELTQQVRDVGDEAVVIEGFSTSRSYRSCGRTLAAKEGNQTIEVALCRGESEITGPEVADIARQVIDQL